MGCVRRRTSDTRPKKTVARRTVLSPATIQGFRSEPSDATNPRVNASHDHEACKERGHVESGRIASERRGSGKVWRAPARRRRSADRQGHTGQAGPSGWTGRRDRSADSATPPSHCRVKAFAQGCQRPAHRRPVLPPKTKSSNSLNSYAAIAAGQAMGVYLALLADSRGCPLALSPRWTGS
jgi:hypothetical protein